MTYFGELLYYSSVQNCEREEIHTQAQQLNSVHPLVFANSFHRVDGNSKELLDYLSKGLFSDSWFLVILWERHLFNKLKRGISIKPGVASLDGEPH